MRLVELLDMHLEEVRNANPLRWELGRLGALCTNLGVGSQIRMLSELIRYAAFKRALHPEAIELDELYAAVRPYMEKMFEYIALLRMRSLRPGSRSSLVVAAITSISSNYSN